MKTIWIVGTGMGKDTMTQEGLAAISGAELLIGAPRLTELFADMEKPVVSEYQPDAVANAIASAIEKNGFERFAVLVSGDAGFFSAATGIAKALGAYDVKLVPGVSSLSFFFSKLKKPWQEAAIVSCHGRENNIADAVRRSRLTFALTGGDIPALARRLIRAGFGELTATVGENLGAVNERVASMPVTALAQEAASALSVLLIENPDFDERVRSGIPDDEFIRGGVPMTKAETRAVTLSKLSLAPSAVCCDIGCGTGSVSVEMALAAYKGKVYAVDKNPEAIRLTEANAEKFHVGNVITRLGGAAEALFDIPALTAAFIGGSGGQMKSIFAAILYRNKNARVVVNAVALESVNEALAAFRENGMEPEITQLCAARARAAGGLHMMAAQNPVFIISGGGNA